MKNSIVPIGCLKIYEMPELCRGLLQNGEKPMCLPGGKQSNVTLKWLKNARFYGSIFDMLQSKNETYTGGSGHGAV